MTTTALLKIRDIPSGKILTMTRDAWLDMISRGLAHDMYEIEV